MRFRVVALLLTAASAALAAADRPNIVWISIEDTGQEVQPYDLLARTPNIARVAEEGVTFLNAFSHSPVCAPTRSGIITGVYPSSIGTHHMRSDMVPPAYMKAFPEYLRRAGYYTTNNSKTDYNFPSPLTAWDENGRDAHWKNRPDRGQPFFAVFNLNSSHESRVGRQYEARIADPAARIHDASKLVLPPYWPDTEKVRQAWAAYYDVVTQTDETVGRLLQEIDDAGLRDSTLVVFWGDHGAGLARHKRWPYDSGVRVPLMARWPGVLEPGSRRTDLVQFLDLAPTMLAAAGADRPDYFHGRVILGPETEPEPRYLFHARDRMDERYDMVRSVRDSRYQYVRNFESHKAWVRWQRTPSRGPIYQELDRAQKAGELGPWVAPFMAPSKPPEELYDVVVDPYELHNLADDPAFSEVLERLREELVAWMKRTNDYGLIPEPEILRTMFPAGEIEQAQPPKAAKQDGRIELTSAEGASIAYRLDGEGRWRLYVEPVDAEGKKLQAKAVRLGYEDSELVVVE